MTWPQLKGHLAALSRHRETEARHRSGVTGVDSWAGAENDPFFASHYGRK